MLKALLAVLIALNTGGAAAKDERKGFLVAPAEFSENHSFKGFRGHDIDAISVVLYERKKTYPEKSEFETIAAWKDRVTKWEDLPLTKALRLQSPLAISVPLAKIPVLNDGVGVRFDAERQVASVQMNGECLRWAGLTLSDKEKKLGEYIGTNAFGVKKKITRIFRTTTCLQFDKQPDWINFHAPFPMDSSVASEMARLGHLVLVGTLVEPYRDSELDSTDPTIDFPYQVTHLTARIQFAPIEIIIVNPATGGVYLRAKKPQ